MDAYVEAASRIVGFAGPREVKDIQRRLEVQYGRSHQRVRDAEVVRNIRNRISHRPGRDISRSEAEGYISRIAAAMGNLGEYQVRDEVLGLMQHLSYERRRMGPPAIPENIAWFPNRGAKLGASMVGGGIGLLFVAGLYDLAVPFVVSRYLIGPLVVAGVFTYLISVAHGPSK